MLLCSPVRCYAPLYKRTQRWKRSVRWIAISLQFNPYFDGEWKMQYLVFPNSFIDFIIFTTKRASKKHIDIKRTIFYYRFSNHLNRIELSGRCSRSLISDDLSLLVSHKLPLQSNACWDRMLLVFFRFLLFFISFSIALIFKWTTCKGNENDGEKKIFQQKQDSKYANGTKHASHCFGHRPTSFVTYYQRGKIHIYIHSGTWCSYTCYVCVCVDMNFFFYLFAWPKHLTRTEALTFWWYARLRL